MKSRMGIHSPKGKCTEGRPEWLAVSSIEGEEAPTSHGGPVHELELGQSLALVVLLSSSSCGWMGESAGGGRPDTLDDTRP